ncbi:MAG: VOC family protein [Actinomycetota bacterium]
MGNSVVHFEVNGPDREALEKFYSELFGWHVQPMPEMGYSIVNTHAGAGIDGGIGQTDHGRGFVTFYVEADDPQSILDKAQSLGGSVVMPVTEIPGVVTVAQFADFDGNIIGLMKSAEPGQEGPPRAGGSNPPVDWFEIGSSDSERARAFYSELFGWELKVHDDMGGYAEVEPIGQGIGGGIGPAQGPGPYVTVYAHVQDLQTTLDHATDLGGTVAVKPMDISERMSFAGILDPQGNYFGLFQTAD